MRGSAKRIYKAALGVPDDHSVIFLTQMDPLVNHPAKITFDLDV